MGNNSSSVPWRKVKGLEWTEKWKDELYKEVAAIKLKSTESTNQSEIGLLLIGPSQHGKSSFINSLATVSKRKKSSIANSGSEDSHLTVQYRRLRCPGELSNFWLGDIKGLTKSSDYDGLVSDIKAVLAGHVKNGYQFMPQQSLNECSPYYIQKPPACDKIHGVIIIYSSEHTEDIQQEYTMGIRNISRLMHDMNIPRCVVLTKCDLLCEYTAKCTTKIFHSKKVQTAVEQAVGAFGVPKGDVHPVVNYENSVDEDPEKSIPFLLAMKAILNKAQDHALQEKVYVEDDDNADEGGHDKKPQAD